MKIAILTEILSTHSGSRAPIELAKYLALNNKVTLIAYDLQTEQDIKKELKTRGIEIILIRPPDFVFGKWLAAFRFLPYLQNQDIISFHGTLPALLVAKLSGKPIVKTYYGTQLNAYLEKFLPFEPLSKKDKCLHWLSNKVILFMERVNFFIAKQTIGISQYTSKEAQKYYGLKIPFIHLDASVISSTLNPISSKARNKVLRQKSEVLIPYTLDPITILSVSRITPYKGFHLLIEAVKKIGKKINLIIVGSSPQPKYLEYLRKIKTAQVKILINISDRELASLYQNCDIYVSADRYLFFGLPPLEAAFFGKPSVILDHCAAGEVVNHQKTGYVCKDLNELIKYLKILVENQNLREKMGQDAKNFAIENFSWEQTAKNYEAVFTNIITGNK